MIRPIMKDRFFLSRKSQPATQLDLPIAQDLLATLMAHRAGCVGMAANMIGESKRIIAFQDGDRYTVMFNPEIVSCSDPYDTEEGCLSLDGVRPATRYQTIKVRYQDIKFKQRIGTYTGWTAQIVQHEIDHCNGILI